ncbi:MULTISPECIES: dihydrofolate reductase family protein [unclassified Pseudonocardia]|uniref:dihydrofolate reductase family protein n=1 Tax=unclassified Pseudonocardia TaxID=2619320 RepID=UPI00094AAA72|nr:dihydrofolate reductase family protein [Pseudonocardia sp. Ae707_Ps1]OLM17945.1 5-amino-6-(5-phosphoribosylamino)uracil reductase [Pseudonocardia sp. Ae707_Ps1]
MPPQPRVTAIMVSSLDGAVTAGGRGSQGLSTPADRELFRALRRAAGVVLVGAGTARDEDYRGVRPRRAGPGEPDPGPPPPVAVVTGSADLDPHAALFTDTVTAPIVLTTADAPAHRRAALSAAGADVAVLPDLAPATLLAELGRRGLHDVLCEGGPTLLGALVAADAVDELRLTLVPVLVGGPAGRIASGPVAGPARSLRPAGSRQADDGTLLLHYIREGHPPNG